MVASRFSSDVLEMFYGPISKGDTCNVRFQPPLRPSRDFDFNLVRTNFSEWLCTWRMTIPFAYEFKADIMKFAQNVRKIQRSGKIRNPKPKKC